MPVAMNAELMSVLVDLPDQLWILLNILADQKESGTGFMLCQHLQDLWCILRVRSIVESQRDLAAGTISLPENGWIAFLLRKIITKKDGVPVRGGHLERAEQMKDSQFGFIAELAVDRQHGGILGIIICSNRMDAFPPGK